MTRLSNVRLICGIALAVLPAYTTVSAQQQPLSPSVTATGASYLLPETRITATVTVTHRTYSPGELARYAERYLRLSDVRLQHAEEWEIQNIGLRLDGVPDTRNIYVAEFGKNSGAPVVRLTGQGVLSSVNAPYETIADEPACADVPVRVISEKSSRTEDPKHYLTEEILLSGSNAKMAELVAREIYDIRESRNMITRGQADYIPSDGESVKYVLQQLDAQEQSLLTMFTGISKEETLEYTFGCIPDSAIVGHMLFRFSVRLGVLENDNLAGDPVWIDVENTTRGLRKPSESKQKSAMLYYRVPGTARIRIYNNRCIFVESSRPVSQFGYTTAVSQDMFGKGKKPVLIFDSVTGALKSVQ